MVSLCTSIWSVKISFLRQVYWPSTQSVPSPSLGYFVLCKVTSSMGPPGDRPGSPQTCYKGSQDNLGPDTTIPSCAPL